MTSCRWKAAFRHAQRGRPTRDVANRLMDGIDTISRSDRAFAYIELQFASRTLDERLYVAATRPLMRYLVGEIAKNESELERVLSMESAS